MILGAIHKHIWNPKSKSFEKLNFAEKSYLLMYGWDILSGISKVPFEILLKIFYR